jgi:hypothetical protein
MSLFKRPGREAKVAGIRLVGIFVPWQAVALTLAVVVGLTSVAILRSGGSTVRVEQSSATGDSSTTTSEPTTTTSTEPPTTMTTDLPARVVYIEKRVDDVDKRVSVIEATTTTTTTVPVPTEPTVMRSYEWWWPYPHSNNGGRIVRFQADIYKPGLKIRFLYAVAGGAVQEFVAEFDNPRVLRPEDASLKTKPEQAVYIFSADEVDDLPSNEAYFEGIVGWEWDGGSKKGPAA